VCSPPSHYNAPLKRTNSRLVTGKDAIALLLVILAVILVLENRSSTTIRFFIPT
jgi:hypothetical protein